MLTAKSGGTYFFLILILQSSSAVPAVTAAHLAMVKIYSPRMYGFYVSSYVS